jgi:hypothetical protein
VSNGVETGQAIAGDDRVDGRSRVRDKGLTSGARLPAEEQVRGRRGGRG